MNSITPGIILFIEDDLADQKLIKTSLKSQQIASDFNIASTAEEALDFLRARGKGSGDTFRPDLILLDLNMPGMGGKEFLKNIKADEELKNIPVVILTTSNSERDIADSYQLQAAGYVHKPVTLAEFRQAIQDIRDYWFQICRLPNRGN